MIEWLAVLTVCQLAGEAAVQAAHLPVPGPVLGMAFLFAGLVWNGRVPEGLGKVADALLFKPVAAVSSRQAWASCCISSCLRASGLPLSAALIVSTLLTIGVTASLMAFLSRKTGQSVKGRAK